MACQTNPQSFPVVLIQNDPRTRELLYLDVRISIRHRALHSHESTCHVLYDDGLWQTDRSRIKNQYDHTSRPQQICRRRRDNVEECVEPQEN